MYAVNEGVEWLLLTNGATWQAYHLTGGLPVQIDLALSVDLLSEESPQKKADQLFYLSREAFKRNLMDDLWKARRATSPKSLAKVILSDPVVAAVQKELRRQTGHAVPPGEIAGLLRGVLRSEVA
jgi:predicted type IV restriction endonuclease